MAIGTTAPQYAHGDGLGSLRLVTDASGNAASSSTCEPWGTPRSGSQTLGGFGYTGEQTDGETGFAYLRARHDDPQTGRFVAKGRIGEYEVQMIVEPSGEGVIAAYPTNVPRNPKGPSPR